MREGETTEEEDSKETEMTKERTALHAVTWATSQTPAPQTPTGNLAAIDAAKKAIQKRDAWQGKNFLLITSAANLSPKREDHLLGSTMTGEGRITGEMTEEAITKVEGLRGMRTGDTIGEMTGGRRDLTIGRIAEGPGAGSKVTEATTTREETPTKDTREGVLQEDIKKIEITLIEGLKVAEVTRGTTTTIREAGKSTLGEEEAAEDLTGAMVEIETTKEEETTLLADLWKEESRKVSLRSTTNIPMRT